MSNSPDPTASIDTRRRQLVAAVGTLALSAAASRAAGQSQNAGAPGAGSTRSGGSLGARLQGVQHFGLTVQNMNRAFEFYTEVLGGNEVMRDGDFHGEKIHNTIMTDQEILAREIGV